MRLAIAIVCAAYICLATASAQAGSPRYLILQSPTPYGSHLGPAHGVSAPTYNWGWFGAKSRREIHRHEGYYGDHFRWKTGRR